MMGAELITQPTPSGTGCARSGLCTLIQGWGDIDGHVPHRALNLGVPEQDLHRTQLACLL